MLQCDQFQFVPLAIAVCISGICCFRGAYRGRFSFHASVGLQGLGTVVSYMLALVVCIFRYSEPESVHGIVRYLLAATVFGSLGLAGYLFSLRWPDSVSAPLWLMRLVHLFGGLACACTAPTLFLVRLNALGYALIGLAFFKLTYLVASAFRGRESIESLATRTLIERNAELRLLPGLQADDDSAHAYMLQKCSVCATYEQDCALLYQHLAWIAAAATLINVALCQDLLDPGVKLSIDLLVAMFRLGLFAPKMWCLPLVFKVQTWAFANPIAGNECQCQSLVPQGWTRQQAREHQARAKSAEHLD